MASLDELSARQIAAGVAAGEFSACEVARAALEAIEQREPAVGAFLEVTGEMALEAARACDAARAAGERLGPLAGVPVAFKDNMNLMGTRTSCASRMLENYVSPYTATCVQRMLDAGAIPLGKTNMDEFAFGSSTESSALGVTRNPWDTTRVPGGSSGGSAAAVASGEVALALGSDTGGSIRQPAGFCGIVGMKPSYGAVSRYGVVAFGSSLDQVGPMGRSVADVALALQALTAPGRDPFDATSQDCAEAAQAKLDAGVAGVRVGVVRSLGGADGVSAEVRAALEAAEAALASAGAVIRDVELPNMDGAISAYYVIGPAEAFSNLARFDGVRYGYQEPGCSSLAEQTAKSRGKGFGAEAKRRQLLGAYLLASGTYDEYYYPALKLRTLITEDYARAFSRCDVLLMPCSPSCAWKFGEKRDPVQMYLADMFTVSSNIAGNCAISLPAGLGEQSGMPVSVQLQAPAFADGELLRYAAALERELGTLGVPHGLAGKGGELA